LFPGAAAVAARKNDLNAYDISKGTVRFHADKPLPTTLVRKLVKARIAASVGSSRARRSKNPGR
jgi:uncharacterized protein YdhG (YjbR/CyaY superfamily)